MFEVKRNGEILQFAWGLPPAPPPRTHDLEQEGGPLLADASALAEGRSTSPCLKDTDGINCGLGEPIDAKQKTDNSADPKPYWNGEDVTKCSYSSECAPRY